MKYSSLCYTLGSCFIFLKSTLYSMVCIWQSHTPKLLLFLYAVKLCLLRMLIHDFWVGNRLLSTSSPLKSVPACMHAKSLQLCPTLWDPWIVAHQVALSMGFSRPEYWSGLPCPPPGKSVQVPFIQREIMLPHHMKAPRHHHHKTRGEVWRLHVQALLPLSSGPHLIQYEPQALCAHDGLRLHQVPQIHAHFSASPSLGNDQRWQPAQAACGEQARDPPLDLSAPGTVLWIIFRSSTRGQIVYPAPKFLHWSSNPQCFRI